MKYKILHDYGNYEGYRFSCDIEFDSVGEAVKHAVAMQYSTPFIIVSVHWRPEYKTVDKPIIKNIKEI